MHLKLGISGFVDEFFCQITGTPDETDTALIGQAEHDAQLCGNILWANGGTLEHPKCSYHYLRTECIAGGAPIFKQGQHGAPLCIQDNTGHTTTIQQLSAPTAYKTLIPRRAPVTAQHVQYQKLLTSAKKHCRTLATSSCHANEAWIYSSSIFLQSIGYPVAVSHLTNSQLDSLQGPIVSVTLQKLGHISCTSCAVVFGPSRYGGIAFHDLPVKQVLNQLRILIRHLRTPGYGQKMALSTLTWLQSNSGYEAPLLEDPTIPAPYLEGYWL